MTIRIKNIILAPEVDQTGTICIQSQMLLALMNPVLSDRISNIRDIREYLSGISLELEEIQSLRSSPFTQSYYAVSPTINNGISVLGIIDIERSCENGVSEMLQQKLV